MSEGYGPMELRPRSGAVMKSSGKEIGGLSKSSRGPVGLTMTGEVSKSNKVLVRKLSNEVVTMVPSVRGVPSIDCLACSKNMFGFTKVSRVLGFSSRRVPSIANNFLTSFKYSKSKQLSLTGFVPKYSNEEFLMVGRSNAISYSRISMARYHSLRAANVSSKVLMYRSKARGLLAPRRKGAVINITSNSSIA